MSFEEYAMEEFAEGQNLGAYEASDEGTWQNAAFSSTVSYDEQNGIEIVGEMSEDLLFMVDTEEVREVNADVEGREYLDPTVEYQVGVEVMNRDEEVVDEGYATFLSGKADQTSAEVWADHAISSALSDEEIEYVEGGGIESTGNGELDFLLDGEEEPSGMDAIDQI